MSTQLQLFIKAPVLGEVKTRMQPVLTPQQSLLLHKELVCRAADIAHDWLKTTLVSNSTASHSVRLMLAGTVPVEDNFVPGLNLPVSPQIGENLGQRMLNGLQSGFDHSDRVLIIGGDCPFIDREYLHQAEVLLVGVDVVLGPAFDGGYVMIGARRQCSGRLAAIFADIDWGTDQVLLQTLERAKQAALSVHCMEPLSDIDMPADLLRLSDEGLAQTPLALWSR
jgi:hypothetical protein